MKLTAIILLAACLQTSARGHSQGISLNLKNATPEKIFNQIEKQTNYLFWYQNDLLMNAQKMNINVQNASIEQVLSLVLKDQSLTFSIIDNLVALKSKEHPDTVHTKTENKTILPLDLGGRIVDEKGEPITASILVKGTSMGTTSNNEGYFTLKNISGDAVLLISSVGYTTQEIAIRQRKSFVIVLIAEDSKMDNVIVVGYGTQKKANVTGSVAAIGKEEIKKVTTSNLVTGLAGRLPGLRITQRTSEPGSFTTLFDIRGYGTPLIVVDGVVMDQGNFIRLNPNDIENISVLKDASAAVYGIKAANGVILVTTKRGEVGKPKVNYNGYYQIQKITNAPALGNAYSYATIHVENEINKGADPSSTTFSREDIENFRNGTSPSTDWYGLVARDYMTQKNHYLSVAGGSDRIRYYTSFGLMNEVGLWKSGDLNYKKYNVRAAVTGKVTDDLDVELSLDGLYDKKNDLAWDSWFIFTSLYWQDPTKPAYTNNNPKYFIDVPGGLHSVPLTDDNYGYLKTDNKTFQGNVKINYRVPFVPGLTAKFMYGYYNQDRYQKTWAKKFEMFSYDQTDDKYNVVNTFNAPSTLTGNYFTYHRSTLLGQLNYDKVISRKHAVNAALIYEERSEKSDNFSAIKQFAIDVDQFFAGQTQNAQINSGVAPDTLVENANKNVVGKFNYNYASKYLVEVGFNYGGSSKFPKGKRWGFFPYASAGWRISEEGFFKDQLPFFTNLKLRGSWGQMGDDGASTFQFLTGYDYPGINPLTGLGYVSVFDGEPVTGLGFRGMPNPNISWYTITTKNIGIDIDIRNGLFSAQFDLFQRDRSGLLGDRVLTIPGTVGANLPQENLNKDMRKGFEVSAGHAKRTGNLRYSVGANFSYTRARMTYIERAPDANSYLNWRNNLTDRWDNIVWGYNYQGQFQSQEEIFNSPLQDNQGNKTLRPGDFKYEDVNKDGMIDDLDIVPIGKGAVPDINYGFNLSVNYKQIDLNVLFQGARNFNYNYSRQLKRPLTWVGRNPLGMFMDRWHHEDLFDANSPWVAGWFPSTGYPESVEWPSRFWRPDASYLRLKSAEIGYTLNQKLSQKFRIQNLRIYASGFNLLTWTKLRFVDPEAIPRDGIYPINKIFNLGANVTF